MKTCYTFELENEVPAAAAAAFAAALSGARLTVTNHGRTGSAADGIARRWFITARRPFGGLSRADWLAEALSVETIGARAAEAAGIPAPTGFGAWVDDDNGGPVLAGYCY